MTEPKYCTNCSLRKPTEGGRYKLSNGGKVKRWLCAECVVERAQIMAARKAAKQ